VTDSAAKQPDLSAARAEVLAFVAGSPMAQNPPRANAVAPLRRLPPELEAKLAGRAGVDASPRDRIGSRIVLPSAVLAVLDAIGIVIGIATDRYALAIVAAVLFVPLTTAAVLGARFAKRDPLRLTAADRRAIADASRWESKQAWTGPVAFCQERGLIIAAVRMAERIARSPAWRSGRIDEQRVRLDLGAELDQIDDQAHRVAMARHQQDGRALGDPTAVDAAWEAALNRVAALTEYANQISGHDARPTELIAQGDPVRDSTLLAGSARDEIALDQLVALTYYLNANRGDLS
jgi:hypothetical protein